jgi:hypothetical protein
VGILEVKRSRRQESFGPFEAGSTSHPRRDGKL